MTADRGPTMPAPRVLTGLPDGDVPVRVVLAAMANAMGHTVTAIESATRDAHAALGADPSEANRDRYRDGVNLERDAQCVSEKLDYLVDHFDAVFPPCTEPVGGFP